MTKKKTTVNEKDFAILAVIIVGLLLAFFVYSNFIPKNFDNRAKISIIEINAECDDCIDISQITQVIEQMNVKIKGKKTLDYNSEEAKKIIKEYNIEKVPTIVLVSKNIDTLDIEALFEVKENYAILDENVPYIDLQTGDIKGLVDFVEIQPECDLCFPLLSFESQFIEAGVGVNEYRGVFSESAEGKEIISKYNLEFAPALMISKDIEEYTSFFPKLKSMILDIGDYYLLNKPIAPYMDLSDNSVKGIVDITYLDNESCEDCYDPTQLKSSFQSLGVYFDKETTFDISSSEGRKLLSKYNITAYPTVILSKEILDYPQLKEVIKTVGTFDEKDQSFIFRKLDSIGEKYQEVNL